MLLNLQCDAKTHRNHTQHREFCSWDCLERKKYLPLSIAEAEPYSFLTSQTSRIELMMEANLWCSIVLELVSIRRRLNPFMIHCCSSKCTAIDRYARYDLESQNEVSTNLHCSIDVPWVVLLGRSFETSSFSFSFTSSSHHHHLSTFCLQIRYDSRVPKVSMLFWRYHQYQHASWVPTPNDVLRSRPQNLHSFDRKTTV